MLSKIKNKQTQSPLEGLSPTYIELTHPAYETGGTCGGVYFE